MFYVIGSGAASISAAVALISRGLQVTILDAGKSLELEKQAILDRISKQEREQWDPRDLDALRGDDQSERHGSVHVKRTYGSDYPYTDVGEPLQGTHTPCEFNYSMARGGLSQVWGASLHPSRAEDIKDWPITAEDLAQHYRDVLKFMPTTAVEDDLAAILPTFTEHSEPFEPSRQITGLLSDLTAHRDSLRRSGIFCGRSRMAVKAGGDERRHACVQCGLCLYGCPYSLIYSSAHTLDRLIENGQVTYIKDHIVEKLEPLPNGVRIRARNIRQGEDVSFEAERVFVGAGILPTASIVLNSLGAYNTPVQMLDSQYFIYPFFRLRKTSGVETELLHSMAQAFLEIDDPAVSRNLVHVEVFSYSDFLKRALMDTPLRFFLRIPWIASELFGRLLVLQCFIHSDDSSRINVELTRKDGGKPMLLVRPEVRKKAFWTSIRAGIKLMVNGLKLGGIPVVPAIQFAAPGRSYHSGGGFPMREKPGRFETDRLGQLPGLDRVHLVDASVFPSIPATTITLTVMANAHRIATETTAL